MRSDSAYVEQTFVFDATAGTDRTPPDLRADGTGLRTAYREPISMLPSQAPSSVNSMSLPLAAQIFLTLVLVVIIAVAVIGNSMVCLAISRSRSLRAQVSNVFIANLAITDLGCASLVMPFSLVSLWFDNWIFGGFLCDVVCFFNYCFIITSMLSLALISVDRHIYVVHPFRYTAIMTHRRAVCLVFATWFVAFIFAAAPPIMRWVIYDNAEVICAINWESNHSQILAYTASAFGICFMSPIFIMVYCYIGIYKVAKSHAKRIAPPQLVGHLPEGDRRDRGNSSAQSNDDSQAYSQPDLTQSCNGNSTSMTRSMSNSQPSTKKTKTTGHFSSKAIRSILVMILAYTICNTPFSLTKLIKVIKISNEAVPFYVNTAAAWFGFVNPCCNPVIYSILREDFRAAFIRLLPRSFRKRLDHNYPDNTIRSHIFNSPKISHSKRGHITVNIIKASPRRPHSPALIENPLHSEDEGIDITGNHGNASTNHAAGIRKENMESYVDSPVGKCKFSNDRTPHALRSPPVAFETPVELESLSDEEPDCVYDVRSRSIPKSFRGDASSTNRRSSSFSESGSRRKSQDVTSLTTTVSV